MWQQVLIFLAQFPQPKNLPQTTADASKIQTVSNILFGVIGAAAVLVISIAAFKFVVHQGEPAEMTKARNSIIYTVVGLVVALSAWTIVGFTIGRL